MSTCNWLDLGKPNPTHSFLVGCLNPCLQGTNIHVSSAQLNRLNLESLHNIIQIHNNVMWTWQHSVKYSPHSDRITLCKGRFTLGVEAVFWKLISLFKRQDLTRPQLQELGPPRMEGQFVALRPSPNFNKFFFSLKYYFEKRSAPEDGLGIWTALLGPLFLYLPLFLSLSISLPLSLRS